MAKKRCVAILSLLMIFNLTACGGTVIQLIKNETGNDIEELRIEYTGQEEKIELNRLIKNITEIDTDELIEKSSISKEDTVDIFIKKDKPIGMPYFFVEGLGTYEVSLEYKQQITNIKIIVEDTTAPIFTNRNNIIEVNNGSTKEDLLTKLTVEDLSKTTITFDETKIDFSTAGDYKVEVTATDMYKNEVKKEFIIKVLSNSEITTPNGNGGATTPSKNPGSSGGNTGGTTPPVKPAEPIVQLTPIPLGSLVFETQEEAWAWAESICNDWDVAKTFAQKYGYSDISGWSSATVGYGYASTGEVMYVKYGVSWRFV